jgi:hypothetical protein
MTTKRKSIPPRTVPRTTSAESSGADPLATVLRTLVIGLVIVRWLIPAESAPAGDTLWIVQLDFAAILLWAWSCLRAERYVVRFSLFDCALWALVAAHCLSTGFVFVTGGDRRSALDLAWEWIGLGTTFFLLRQTIRTALDARRLAAIVVALAVVLGGLGIWQHYLSYRLATREYTEMINELESLEKNPRANPERLGKLQLTLQSQGIPADEIGRRQYVNRLRFSNEAFGPFALANTFAGFLVVMLLLAAELFRTREGPRSKGAIAAWIAAFLVLVYCLILTKSRTAWAALIVAGVVWGVAVLVRNRRLITRRAIAALGKGFDAEVISEAPKSLAYRFQYWNGAVHTVADSPIFGTGPGNFRHHYLRHKVPESSEEIADPHNWLLDLWASGGILAVVSFFACLVLAVAAFRKRGRDDETRSEPPEPTAHAPWTADLPGPILGFLLAVIAPVAAANGNFDAWQLPLLAAWVFVFPILRHGLGSARLAPVVLVAGALGLLIHLSGAGGIEMPAVVQIFLVLVAFAFATRGQPEHATAAPLVPIAIGGVGVVLFVSLFLTGTLPLLNRRAAIAAGEQALFVDGQFEQAEGSFLQAAHSDPLSPEPHDRLADAYFAKWRAIPPGGATDYFAKARVAMAEAMTQDPGNPMRYRRLGEFYLAKFERSRDTADAKGAADAFQRAVDIYPTDAMLRSSSAMALSDAGQPAEAKSQAQRALELDEINHRWGHTDRYLSDSTLARLRQLAKTNP